MKTSLLLRKRVLQARREDGYLILAALIALTFLIIAMAAEAPRIAQQIKREREEEMVHRGNQYVRAIKRYYKKFGRYPTTLDQLENTNNIRFLRRRYKDPITGKDDWRLIHVGEAKVQPKTFSQGGSAGGGQAGGRGAGGAGSSATGMQSGAGMMGGTGMPGGGIQGATSNVGTPVSSMSSGLGGRTIGGGPIIGVSSLSEAESLKELNEQKHYNEWEFVYDPRLDPTMQNMGGGIPGGIRPGQLGGPGTPGGPGTGPTRR